MKNKKIGDVVSAKEILTAILKGELVDVKATAYQMDDICLPFLAGYDEHNIRSSIWESKYEGDGAKIFIATLCNSNLNFTYKSENRFFATEKDTDGHVEITCAEDKKTEFLFVTSLDKIISLEDEIKFSAVNNRGEIIAPVDIECDYPLAVKTVLVKITGGEYSDYNDVTDDYDTVYYAKFDGLYGVTFSAFFESKQALCEAMSKLKMGEEI